MPLVGSSVFAGLIEVYRVVWFEGRYGGGKTAAAVRFAYDLLEKGFVKHLVSNIPVVFESDPWDIEPVITDTEYRLDTVILLDEGGLFLETGKDVKGFLAFLRKMNIVLLIPSVEPPATTIRKLSVTRRFNGYKIAIPAWVYRYTLSTGGYKDTERFYWLNPTEVFGLYDTDAKPVDDAGIGEWFQHHTSRAVERYYQMSGRRRSRTHDFSEVEESRGINGGEFLEAAERFAEAAETFSMVGDGKKKRK